MQMIFSAVFAVHPKVVLSETVFIPHCVAGASKEHDDKWSSLQESTVMILYGAVVFEVQERSSVTCTLRNSWLSLQQRQSSGLTPH